MVLQSFTLQETKPNFFYTNSYDWGGLSALNGADIFFSSKQRLQMRLIQANSTTIATNVEFIPYDLIYVDLTLTITSNYLEFN